MTDTSFIDAVAERNGCSADEVADLLALNGVPTSDDIGTPHRLRVTRLAFTGRKAGMSSGDIDFEQEFGDGLWALTSEKNDRGKTSIMEIMMWALRGRPKRLQDDVRSWLRSVTLDGSIDDEPFTVEFELTDGEPEGRLTCDSGDDHPFASDAAFDETMSSFMMQRLGFDSFPQWMVSTGISTHGWPSYSTVLYMPRESQSTIIGDVVEGGVTQRLVSLFVGVRWARTLIASQAALKQTQAETSERQAATQAIRRVADSVLDSRRQELEATITKIARLPDSTPAAGQVEADRAEWLELLGQHDEARSELQEARHDEQAARREATRRKKQLTGLREAEIAQRLFHGLDPTTCPRCSTDIEPDRRQVEADTHSCALCTRQLNPDNRGSITDPGTDSEDGDDRRTIEELEQLVAEIERVAEEEHVRVERLSSHCDALKRKVAAAEACVKAHESQSSQIQQRHALDIRAAELRAIVSELESLAGEADAVEPVSPNLDSEHRIKILEAATKEAKKRVNDGWTEVEERINEAILDLARRFGFGNLQEVRLNRAAQLRLRKGGVRSSFSKQTPGEKLRLRIAVTVALLRVAAQLDIGRHPGLLLIDSIGAEETEPGDLAEFMRELVAVTDELGIETIVASARPEILTHVPEDRRVTATGDSYLW